MSDYNLENDIFRLLREEPFFAAISRCVNKSATNTIPTAGVFVSEDGNYELIYNREYMANKPDHIRRGILKHEFYHLLFEHCGLRMYDEKEYSHKLQNVATDLAINCHLKGELPETAFYPSSFGFDDYLATEQYISLLLNKFPQEKQVDGNGKSMEEYGEKIDDHEKWGDGPEGTDSDRDGNGMEAARAIARERLREAARKGAADAAQSSKGWGNMHQSVRDMIMRFVNGSVDWRAVLRNFIGQSQRANRTNTVKRVNKRFPYIHPGRKVNHTAHIAIAIDQSGSVGDDLLALFFAELNGLAKLATFTVVPFDTATDDKLVFQWKKGDKYQPKRVMRGGTCFDAPTAWVNDHPEIDGLIILTDMEAPAPKPCKRRRLWMTNKEGKDHPYFQTNEIVVEVRDMNSK